MGAGGSSHVKERRAAPQADWIAPTSSRKGSAKRSRLAALLRSRCPASAFPRLQSRRKNRAISRDTQRAFRELISSWSCSELAALCQEMESGCAVRELAARADTARPRAPSLAAHLLHALNTHSATDCFVVFKDTRFAVHSSVLRARSRYFAAQWGVAVEEASGGPSCSAPQLYFPDDGHVPAELFFAALHFIYSAEIPSSHSLAQRPALENLLSRLGCGMSLPNDLADFDFASRGDCMLIFTANGQALSNESGCSRDCDGREYRVRCSSSILAARSDFLRALIERRRGGPQPWSIVIDEHLIPRVYAPVVLHAIYTDRLDLSKVMDGCRVSASSLNEVQAIASGRRQRTPLRHAIEVYHIAKFLNLERLAQLCEDVMIAEMSVESVAGLWLWACDAGGSPFVRRQCVAFLCAEFARVCFSHLLFELDEELLRQCLLSDFLQCSEVEILESLVRWGEHELVRRMEEREPNLLVNTTHSISRKGVRRSELDDEELKRILSALLPLVRIDYLLPPFHLSLSSAYKRGLLDRSPSADILGLKYPDSRSPDVNPDAHWFDHSVPRRHPSGPRLLIPYFLEAKAQLRRLCGSGADVLAEYRRGAFGASNRFSMDKFRPSVINTMPEVITEEKRAQAEKRIIRLLREEELVKTAFSCGCEHHRNLAIEQVRLRVLREQSLEEEGIHVLCQQTAAVPANEHYALQHYCSQPALALSFLRPDLTTCSQPGSPHSEYDNESVVCSPPDILLSDTTV